MKHYRCISLFALLALLLPGLSRAQDVQIHMPAGWANVTAGVTQTAYGPVPAALVEKAATVKFLAVDPKALGTDFAVNMFVMVIPLGSNTVTDYDGFYDGVVKGMEEKLPADSKMVEARTFTYKGAKMLRSAFDLSETNAAGKPMVIRTMEYYFVAKDTCYAFMFMSKKDDFGRYGPIFQDSFLKSLNL